MKCIVNKHCKHFLFLFPLFLSLLSLSCTAGGGKGGPTLTGTQIFSSGKYVYVFNPAWRIISRVDPASSSVSNITLGEDPADAKATPDGRSVIVLNRGSENVYIIDTENNGITVKSTGRNLNSIVVSPSSDFAVAFHIYSETEVTDFEGVLKLNEYSIINLKTSEDDTKNITLGGGAPQGVKFSPDGKKVLIISRNRCFVLSPEEPYNYSSIELWPDPSNIIIPSQIEITPDGRFAFIRTQNTDYLYVIDMNEVRVIDVLEGNKPAFFGIFPDGSRAILINSGDNTAVILRIDYSAGRVYQTKINAGISVNSAGIGQYDYHLITGIMEDIKFPVYYAVLFSTTSSENKIVYLAINGNTGIVTKTIYGFLPAPVENVGISIVVPSKILITHRTGARAKTFPLSILDIEEEIVNPLYLDARPTSLAITPPVNGSIYAFLTLKDSNRIAYYNMSTGDTDDIEISALPFTAGVMDKMLYILHDQPLGTITFLNLENFETIEIKGVTVNGLLDR